MLCLPLSQPQNVPFFSAFKGPRGGEVLWNDQGCTLRSVEIPGEKDLKGIVAQKKEENVGRERYIEKGKAITL